MLKYRLLTAIILIPLVIAAIFLLPKLLFTWVCIAIIGLAASEWAQLIGWNKIWQRLSYVVLTLLFFGITLLLSPLFFVALASLVWLVICAFLTFVLPREKLLKWPLSLVGFTGVFLLSCFGQALIMLQATPYYLLYLLIVVWFADSVAYFAGRAYGKNKLAPAISPKKTKEGTYAALVAVMAIAIVAQILFGAPNQQRLAWLMITLPTFIAAVAGDLMESYFKRQVDLKDTGQLLPGHGGVLDRLDSLIAAAPVFVCGAIAAGIR